MKLSRKKINFLLLIISVFLLSISLLISSGKKALRILSSRAKIDDFSIVLNNDNAVYSSGSITQKTLQRGNNVSFSYSNVGTYLLGHTKLNAGGSLKNTDQITSITSISVMFSTEGSLLFRISYDGINWSNTTRADSEQVYELHVQPYYVEFLTDGNNSVDIDEIRFNFSCVANPNINEGVPQIWDNISNSTVDLNNVNITSQPYGLKLSYYSDIYSRGFAWTTDEGTTDSHLYVVESDEGSSADFIPSSYVNGTCIQSGGVSIHKAFIENLNPSTTYSYKVGSHDGWAYGTFKTEDSNPTSITAIQISDAQTKDPNKLYVWENTFAQAIETAGKDLDMILYNGDQNQKNSLSSYTDQIDYSTAIETINPYLESTPYMAVAGNHDYGIYTENNCIDFTNLLGGSDNDMYYSYDYGDAHFVVLNTNNVPGLGRRNQSYPDFVSVRGFSVDSTLVDQANWLIEDLESAHSNGKKWIIVTMHLGPHSTGDHSSEDQAKRVNASFTPIFSTYHVDLVFQAHDHTYAKTLPYKWDTDGHTEVYQDSSVVNLNPIVTVSDGKTYDLNPQGTYYVTTGAAGHRMGEAEGKDGIFADLIPGTMNPLVSDPITGNVAKPFVYNYYKTVVGKLTQSNSYNPYTATVNGYTYTSSQNYSVGNYAAGNVNANMFGVLNIKGSTLTYDIYTVRGNEVRLFDTLNVMKDSNVTIPSVDDSGEYSIDNAEDLSFVLNNDAYYNADKITLTDDIDLGENEINFDGITELDGQGHTISSSKHLDPSLVYLSYSHPESYGETYNCGLFSEIHENTVIRDLTIDGAEVGSYENGNCGVLVGSINGRTHPTVLIENVTVKNSVVYARQKGSAFIGSISDNSTVEIDSNCKIENCDVYTLQGEAAKVIGGAGPSTITNYAQIDSVRLHRGPNNDEIQFSTPIGGTINGQQTAYGYLVNAGDDLTESYAYYRIFNENAVITIWNTRELTYNGVSYYASGNSGSVYINDRSISIKGTIPLIL